MIMDSSTNYFRMLKRALNVGLVVCCFICLLSITVLAVDVEAFKQGSHEVEAGKMMIGSRPPRCLNRCLNCNPCKATLVITSHHKNGFDTTHSRDDDRGDNYYLLTWKCKCRNKLFQP